MLPDVGVQLGVALQVVGGGDGLAPEAIQRRLAEDVAGDADGGAELFPVLRVGHVVEEDAGVFLRVGAGNAHAATAG